MILHNVQFVGEEGRKSIRVQGEEITLITDANQQPEACLNDTVIELDNALAFPGLINSHDHLDFNLFPQLGNRIYNNYTEWGRDIHDNNKALIDAVLKIPANLRVQWGLYKNLLNGVTTVVNHGEKLTVNNHLADVFQDCVSLHSIAFENKWKYKLNRGNAKKIVAIHIGEGTDALAAKEIRSLISWNLFKKKLVGIHAVAMSESQAAYFEAIVWCPVSNIYLLNETAAVDVLKHKTNVLFGTDSTLTAEWNIWEQLRLARSFNMLNDDELFTAVTKTAASVWQLNAGKLAVNKTANIVVAKNKQSNKSMDSFYSLNPEDILLVMKAGKIVLLDDSLLQHFLDKKVELSNFSQVIIAGKTKHVAGNLPALAIAIKQYHPGIEFPFEIN